MGVLGVLAVTPLLYGQNPATPGGLPYSAAPDVAAYTAFVTEAAQRYKARCRPTKFGMSRTRCSAGVRSPTLLPTRSC